MPRDGYPQEYVGRNFSDEVKNVNRLTMEFAKAAAKKQDDANDNLVISPYNALQCLSMVAAGADTQTREEMASTLFGVDAAELDDAIESLADLNNRILEANKEQVELKTANGVWTNRELLTLDTDYADGLKKDFGAEISAENFADPAVVDQINDWADKNTNGLINEILESLEPNDFAVLASSLYFKGDWTDEFDEDLTKDKVFTADDGSEATTAIMQKDFEDEGIVRYLKEDDYEAVALTYGKKDMDKGQYPTMRMVLIRPTDENVSARDLLSSQAGDNLPTWMEPNAYSEAMGRIELPRMDMKENYDLIPVLEDMGIKSAFNSAEADFSKMTEERARGLYLSQVSHDTVFKTNEKGSEAAAVTTAVMTLECVMPTPEVIDVKFDRSYIFALQDVQTGAVIFTGAVNKPNEDMTPVQKRTCGNTNKL